MLVLMAGTKSANGDKRRIRQPSHRGGNPVNDPPEAFPNLTLTRIPPAVIYRREWGKDHYSPNAANISAMTPAEPALAPSGNRQCAPRRQRNPMARYGTGAEGAES